MITRSDTLIGKVSRAAPAPGRLPGDSWASASRIIAEAAAMHGIAYDAAASAGALDDLTEACQFGKVRAKGYRPDLGYGGALSLDDWSFLALHDGEGEEPIRAAVPSDRVVYWTDLRFAVDDMQRVWAPSESSDFWANLWIDADVCVSKRPVSADGAHAESATPADCTTDEQKREWMFQHQQELKAARKGHGREVILSAARERFGVRHKVVSDIWNDAASKKQRLENSSARKSP
jgi:hypothetical protein